MKVLNDENFNKKKINLDAMALAYQEMGKINLEIATEMDHLEIEAMIIIEEFYKVIEYKE